jgi:hypothetical protein
LLSHIARKPLFSTERLFPRRLTYSGAYFDVFKMSMMVEVLEAKIVELEMELDLIEKRKNLIKRELKPMIEFVESAKRNSAVNEFIESAKSGPSAIEASNLAAQLVQPKFEQPVGKSGSVVGSLPGSAPGSRQSSPLLQASSPDFQPAAKPTAASPAASSSARSSLMYDTLCGFSFQPAPWKLSDTLYASRMHFSQGTT